MFASFPLVLLIPVFLAGAAAVWLAGIQLSNTTDVIDARFGLGEALGGLVLLAIATNLPEIAIVVSASLSHNIGIAIGNILGGIAIQTVVLVILDGFGLRRKGALTYEAASSNSCWKGCWSLASLAAATSLPEVSTGLASVNIGDYQLAVSDIFGGNAFLPVLFLPATLLSGQSVLPQAKNTDIYLASLGVLLTAVYIYGLIFRPKRQFLDLGIDSQVVLVFYLVGVVGLFTIVGGK